MRQPEAITAKKYLGTHGAANYNLVDVRQDHNTALLRIARKLDPSIKDREAFETRTAADAMEGGTTVEEFLEKNRHYLQTKQGIVEAAMINFLRF
jgi:hypothetical protein